MISRRGLLVAGTAVAAAGASTAVSAAPAKAAAARGRAGGRTGPVSVVAVDPADTAEEIIAKAAAIVPRPSQVAWQKREVTGFTHFGMNTFTDREWGSGCEDEATFAPSEVDIDQWMRAYRAAGMKQVMLTAKHHDGFVVYPTRYTNHSVIASPWWYRGTPDTEARAARARAAAQRATDPWAYWRIRAIGNVNPDGDILGTYLRAARKAGLKVGVYLSPADGAELPHAWHKTFVADIVAKHDAGGSLSIEEQATYDDRDRGPAGMGRYGSGSPVTARTIPTLVPGDDRADAVRSGRLPSFRVMADDYNAYYMNQLYELFTQYGPIDELWLDGADPWTSSGISETYDFTSWFGLIHALSPDTVTFAGPQGTRWVGNEGGRARLTEWSVTPATADPATAHGETLLPGGPEAADIGSDTVITGPGVKFLQWFPAEADVSIRPGWFWHADERPKTAEQLVDLYHSSVGRNAVLLLNVPPNTSGRIDDADVACLTGFGRAIEDLYRHNLLRGARPSRVAEALTDPRLGSCWSPAAGARTATLELTLGRTTVFDRIRLGEDITRGQHVQQFAVDARTGTAWSTVATGTTIGYARILVLPAPVTAERIRVRVIRSRATPHLSTLGLYLKDPAAADR
ncbi:alpha-L-fucosidase [Streptomyces mexicanus]|uniref:alpha-L-fucosidase n=1 Tax=Streptomyces mexicanus TaxID=178566 RepID=A0A7X1I171_9ACTN|nr:alpha-L-fucosidase [Streptomyces mexicanus]MBC2866929.1 alpha-L-fucosidase [Streptomyces mexicanus]